MKEVRSRSSHRKATPADRPSVTDNARTENMHDPCCSSHGVTMTCSQYRRTHFVEVRPCCGADAELLAAGRAETTTATTEDMTTRLAAAEAELDRLCNGGRFTMSIPAREGYDSDLLIQAALSDLRGLLARPTPSRDEIIDALVMSPLSDTAGTDLRPFEQTADAVLDLLEGGTG